MYDRDVEFSQRYQLKKVEGTDDIFDLIPAPGTVNNEGTLINKAALLKDMTAALFGLTVDAVPDEVLSFLGKYNQHWWSRKNVSAGAWFTKLGEQVNGATLFSATQATYSFSFKYSASVTVAQDTGAITLESPKSETCNWYSWAGYESTLRGKYVKMLTPDVGSSPYKEQIIYVPTNSNFSADRSSTKDCKADIQTVSSFYDDSGVFTEYLRSSERNAYPDSGEHDGYEYQYLGVPFENAVGAPKIETGSYIGTGTYGSSNPNSLTFGFVPKFFVCLSGKGKPYLDTGSDGTLWVNGFTYGGNYGTLQFAVSESTLSWYTVNSADTQLNASGTTYYYIAIG